MVPRFIITSVIRVQTLMVRSPVYVNKWDSMKTYEDDEVA